MDVVGTHLFIADHEEQFPGQAAPRAKADSQALQLPGMGQHRRKLPDADCQVEDGLGADGGDCCAADMADLHRHISEHPGQKGGGLRRLGLPLGLMGHQPNRAPPQTDHCAHLRCLFFSIAERGGAVKTKSPPPGGRFSQGEEDGGENLGDAGKDHHQDRAGFSLF